MSPYQNEDGITIYSERQAKRIETIKRKYGEDFFKKSGEKGGKAETSNTKKRGFASSGKASEAGTKGANAIWQKYGKEEMIKRLHGKQEKKNDK